MGSVHYGLQHFYTAQMDNMVISTTPTDSALDFANFAFDYNSYDAAKYFLYYFVTL